jgi:hypothetical protein
MAGEYMKSFQPSGPDYLKSFAPDAPADPDVVAHAAADAPPTAAVKAVDIANETGVAPDYVAGDLEGSVQQRDKLRFAAQLQGRPVLTAWAGQSTQHAAAVKRDAGPLGTIEGWFSGLGDAVKMGFLDIGHAEAMREYMGAGGPLAQYAIGGEQALQEYDGKAHGYAQQVARAVPQMVMYGATTILTGGVGLAGLLYAQNKGVLARQIQLAQPGPLEDTRERHWVTGKDGQKRWMPIGPEPEDTSLTADEVDKYATVGSAAAAVTLAGLLGPLVRSLPGAKSAAQSTLASVLARAAATTVGRAAVRGLVGYGQHTLMGALGMTLQATINSATVQKASGKDVDIEQLGRESVDTFVKVLPIAATFAAYGPGREFLEDRARINGSPVEIAKLNAMVEQAKAVSLVKHSPNLASDLFGAMGRGATVYINYKAAAKIPEIPREALAAAEVSQGDVAVPLNDYLARMSDQHEQLKDDVKLTADGMTMNEARERTVALRQVLSPEEARALYGKLAPDELQGLEMPIAADASPELARKLNGEPQASTVNQRTPQPEKKTAEAPPAGDTKKFKSPGDTVITTPLHENMAKEYGGTPEKWAQMLTPELLGALNEEGHVGAISPEEHAARLVEAMPIGAIDTKPFEQLAKKSSKYIQEAAEKARTGSVAGAKASSPADVAILHTYELARDVNLAKAKKAAEVSAEMGKALDNLSKQAANQKLRALMQRAGAPVLHLFDALTEGASASPTRQGWVAAHQEAVDSGMKAFSPEATQYADARMAGALDEARQWFKDSARPFNFNDLALQRFLAKPKPWSELLPAEARNITDAVKQLTTAAREESIVRRADSEATVREVADEISGELAQNPSKGLPLPTGIPSTWTRDRLLDANAANAIQLRPKNNLRQKSTAAVKWIFDRINQAVYVRDGLFRDVGEMFKTAFDNVPEAIAARRYETYDLSGKLPVQGMEPLTAVPRQWLWKMAQHRMSAGNMERVVSTSGWDKSTIDSILFDDAKTKLTVPEWDYLQSLADIKEKFIWPKLKEHFEKFYGQAPPKTAGVPFKVRLEDGTWKDYAGGYEPLKRDARPGVAPQAEPTKGIAQYWGRDNQIPWTPGSAKERIDNSHYLVNMDWDSGRATIAQTLHWLAFDQPVRDVAKLLNDTTLAANMNQYMGEGRADMTRGWLKSSATRQAQSIPEGMEIVGRAFGWQRRLQLMQIVGGSARLAVAQLSHPAGLMMGGEVNPIHGIPALLSTFKPLELANGEVRLFPNWNDAILYGKEVQHRADNAYGTLRQTWDKAGPSKPGPLGALRNVALKTAGLYLHAVDRLTTSWAWTAFHNEAVAKGMEPFSPEAIAHADSRTQDVMPVHDAETAAPILTNRQMGGFLIMHGFKNTLYNMRQDALAKSVRDFHLAGTPSEYGGAIARTAGRVALQTAMFGGFAIMGKFALGYGQQGDESKGQWLARDFLAGQSTDLPLVGGLGEPLAKLLVGGKLTRRDFTPYGNPGIAAVTKAQDLLGNLVNDSREDSKKVFDAVETALFYTGVPSRAPRVGAEHLYNLLMGEGYDDAETTASDIGGHLFYTDKQWESIKRSLTPDED